LHFSTLVRATVSATCRNGRHWRTHRCISVPSFGPMGLQLSPVRCAHHCGRRF